MRYVEELWSCGRIHAYPLSLSRRNPLFLGWYTHCGREKHSYFNISELASSERVKREHWDKKALSKEMLNDYVVIIASVTIITTYINLSCWEFLILLTPINSIRFRLYVYTNAAGILSIILQIISNTEVSYAVMWDLLPFIGGLRIEIHLSNNSHPVGLYVPATPFSVPLYAVFWNG